MLKQIKLNLLQAAESTGVTRAVRSSDWRRRRLLILCYHGISRFDEHECMSLYMTASKLRRRMEALRDARANVLPLDEAVRRLYEGTLPERAVAITFDDGMVDFHQVAFPLVESYGYPATLYLTTYYVTYNRPIFDPMCEYVLWKGRNRKWLDVPHVFGERLPLDDEGRRRGQSRLREYALEQRLSGQQKDALLADIAGRLGVDYEELCRRRMMHLINVEEARDLVRRGLDVQFHTHRHRMYNRRERMIRELADNARVIASITDRQPRHFCYTGGTYLPEHVEHLREYGIRSATTCRIGLCSPEMDPLTLPRLVDGEGMTDLEFRSWLDGTAEFIPRRKYQMDLSQLGIDD